MKWRTGAAAAVFVAWILAAPAGQSQQVEWFTYGGDPASSKYSPADDITPQNVARLAIAWQWEHGEKPLEQYGTTPYRFENQPLMVDGVLYVTTPYNNAVALDPSGVGRTLRLCSNQSAPSMPSVPTSATAGSPSSGCEWRRASCAPPTGPTSPTRPRG